jgi:small subunit ribosomal protein S17e
MGKVRPLFIKSAARDLVAKYPDYLSTDFEKNKAFLNQATIIHSKRVRNRLAGFICQLKKREHISED